MDYQPWSSQVEGSSTEEDEMDTMRESPRSAMWGNEQIESQNFPFSEEDREGQERLKKLYQYVNQKETPLPRRWSAQDKCNWLILSHDSLSMTYNGQGKDQKDSAAVRADHPIPITCGIYYFEVLVISNGPICCMGIGLCEKNVNLKRLPGWDKCSYGYHGDDGNFFSSCSNGKQYGPTFTTNDVVGCGLNILTRTIFYTKNGTNLGSAIKDIPNVANLYPVVGLQQRGEILQTNFGQRPFKYNIELDIQEAISHTYNLINHVELSQSKTAWMNHAIGAWLAHEGYSRAFNAFNKFNFEHRSSESEKLEALGKHVTESSESMENRRAISLMILHGKVDEAISHIDRFYPTLLQRNKELALMLKCQQFVEMFVEINAKTTSNECFTDNSQFEKSSDNFRDRSGYPSPKSARLSSASIGFGASYATVYTQNGRSFKVTPFGYAVGNNGVNAFKRRIGEEAVVFQGRRSSLHSAQHSLAQVLPTLASTSTVAAENDSCHMGSANNSADGDCISDGTFGLSFANGVPQVSNGISVCCSNGVTPKANGTTFSRASATTIVAEDQDGMLGEYRRKLLPEENACSSGYTKAELAPFEKYQSLLHFGRTINALSLEIPNIPEKLLTVMNDAFALICQASHQSRMAYLMDPIMRERAARATNSAILRFLGYPEESVLARYFRKARSLRQKLLQNHVVSAVFTDIDKMVLGERVVQH